MQKIKNLLLTSGIASFMLAAGLAVPLTVSAVDPGTGSGIAGATCQGANDSVSGGEDGACDAEGGGSFTAIITTIVNIFSIIIGAVAVIMIIYGGFRYITSGGDSNGVTAAKNTILYAVIGLIIVALAQVIVRFVIGVGGDAAEAG